MATLTSFTFVCLAANQVATHVDVQDLEEVGVRPHARQLLRDHASANAVEVWRDERVWEVIGRDGVRAIAGGRDTVDPALGNTLSVDAGQA